MSREISSTKRSIDELSAQPTYNLITDYKYKLYNFIEDITGFVPNCYDANEFKALTSGDPGITYNILEIRDILHLNIDLISIIRPDNTYLTVDVVVVEDVDKFLYRYKVIYGVDYDGDVVTYNDFGKWLIDNKRFDSVIDIAIFTSNVDAFYKLMERSFGKLTYEEEDDSTGDIQGDTDDDDIKAHKHHCPFRHFRPKLYEGWIYRIWYMKPPKRPQPPKPIEPDTDDTDTGSTNELDSFVEASVSVKTGNNIFTYWLITPGNNIDLTDFADLFDHIYIDLDTRFPVSMIYPTCDTRTNISPCLFYVDEDPEDIRCYSIGRLTNIFSNYVSIDKYINRCYKHIWDYDINYNPRATYSYVREGCFYPLYMMSNMRQIKMLHEIRLPGDLDKETELEEDND